MPHLLSLKAIAFDTERRGFYSPSHRDFLWTKDVVVASCNRCANPDQFNPDCTHGIYSSPNVEALAEYATYKNSVLALMQCFGWIDIWTGPHDIPDAYILRSWGVQILGVIGESAPGIPLSGQRQLSAINANRLFDVPTYTFTLAKGMIALTWKNIKIHPYKKLEETDAWFEAEERLEPEWQPNWEVDPNYEYDQGE